MQSDMHYFGTYCIARAAGIKKSAAQKIAYASQFVDDSKAGGVDDHKDGSKIVAIPTAHHPSSLKNINRKDQRYIWVPFHFIPGGKGKTFTEKLVCRKNSKLAQEMVKHNISQVDKPYIFELLGITAHVYADTFAHYGFSGISSRRNRVDGATIKVENPSAIIDQILGETLSRFFQKYGLQGGLLENIRSVISFGGEIASGALGHGAVSIYPDQPYLKWSYEYEYATMATPKDCIRNNPKTFLEGAEALHSMFHEYFLNSVDKNKARDYNVGVEFSEIKNKVKEIFATEGDKFERAELWRDAAKKGLLYNKKERIPEYDKEIYEQQREDFPNLKDSRKMTKLGAYRFYQAASFHKHYVLRELLPKYGIVVI